MIDESLILDATIPWLENYWDEALLQRFWQSGINCVSLTVQDFPTSYQGSLRTIARFRQQFAEAFEDWLCWAPDVASIRAAQAAGRLAVQLNIQDTLPIETDLGRVDEFYAAGVRHMLLAYQGRSLVADGCAEPANAGLSLFGRRLIGEMNRLGMLVDLSHTGRRSALEASALSTLPVIYSHSGVRPLSEHIRNVDDEQIQACVDTDGVIGIVGIGAYLGDVAARSETLFRHIDYVVQGFGPRHVGIGSDYLADMTPVWNYMPGPCDYMPDPSGTQLYSGEAWAPEGYPELVQLMLDKGYTREAISGILGGNFLRVLEAAESVRTNK